LQQIVSSFISDMIILLDRSLIIGDCAQLENGHKGKLLELNMQLATLETFDDKEIMVPNEKLITMTFTNWTHNHKLQCYRSTSRLPIKPTWKKCFQFYGKWSPAILRC
jgi:small-conductance mechanosensitive channel